MGQLKAFAMLSWLVLAHCALAAAPATQPAPAWLSKPPATWPNLRLTNRVVATDNSAGNAGSCSFGRLPNGVVVLFTVEHILNGVKPADFKTAFKSWTAVGGPGATTGVRLTSVAMDTTAPSGVDALILLPASQQGPFPSVLPVREEPLHEGETVYLIGIPTEPGKRQAVHKAVVQRLQRDLWIYSAEGTFKTTGNSGAPIIDEQGRLAAVNVGHLNDQTEPGHMLLTCLDTATLLPHVKLPPGMKPLVLAAPTTKPSEKTADAKPVSSDEDEAEKQLKTVEIMQSQGIFNAAQARAMLEQVIAKYPNTAAAKKAKAKLAGR